MKKHTLVLFGLILLSFLAKSQDIIVKIDKQEIKAKVTEVELETVKYKAFENINGPTYTILKTDISYIKYENGTKEIYKKEEVTKVDYTKLTNQELETQLNQAVAAEEYSTATIIQKEIDKRAQSEKMTTISSENTVKPVANNIDESITFNKNGRRGREFFYHGEKISTAAVKDFLSVKSTPAITKEFSEGKTIELIGRVLNSSGIGITLISEIVYLGSHRTIESAKLLMFGGAGIIVMGTIIQYAGRSQMKKSILKYNNSLNKPTSLKLDFGITPNGIGFTFYL